MSLATAPAPNVPFVEYVLRAFEHPPHMYVSKLAACCTVLFLNRSNPALLRELCHKWATRFRLDREKLIKVIEERVEEENQFNFSRNRRRTVKLLRSSKRNLSAQGASSCVAEASSSGGGVDDAKHEMENSAELLSSDDEDVVEHFLSLLNSLVPSYFSWNWHRTDYIIQINKEYEAVIMQDVLPVCVRTPAEEGVDMVDPNSPFGAYASPSSDGTRNSFSVLATTTTTAGIDRSSRISLETTSPTGTSVTYGDLSAAATPNVMHIAELPAMITLVKFENFREFIKTNVSGILLFFHAKYSQNSNTALESIQEILRKNSIHPMPLVGLVYVVTEPELTGLFKVTWFPTLVYVPPPSSPPSDLCSSSLSDEDDRDERTDGLKSPTRAPTEDSHNNNRRETFTSPLSHDSNGAATLSPCRTSLKNGAAASSSTTSVRNTNNLSTTGSTVTSNARLTSPVNRRPVVFESYAKNRDDAPAAPKPTELLYGLRVTCVKSPSTSTAPQGSPAVRSPPSASVSTSGAAGETSLNTSQIGAADLRPPHDGPNAAASSSSLNASNNTPATAGRSPVTPAEVGVGGGDDGASAITAAVPAAGGDADTLAAVPCAGSSSSAHVIGITCGCAGMVDSENTDEEDEEAAELAAQLKVEQKRESAMQRLVGSLNYCKYPMLGSLDAPSLLDWVLSRGLCPVPTVDGYVTKYDSIAEEQKYRKKTEPCPAIEKLQRMQAKYTAPRPKNAPKQEEDPQFIFLGGGMAAGKSTAAAALAQSDWWKQFKDRSVLINADKFKTDTDITNVPPKEVHELSVRIAEKAVVQVLNMGHSIVFDGTMMWAPFVRQTIDMIRHAHTHFYEQGPGYLPAEGIEQYFVQSRPRETPLRKPYNIQFIGITVAPEVAVPRGFLRKFSTGRGVPIPNQLNSFKLFSQNFPEYARLVDTAVLLNNNVMVDLDKGEVPPKVAEKTHDMDDLEIYDAAAYAQFQKQRHLNIHAGNVTELYVSASVPVSNGGNKSSTGSSGDNVRGANGTGAGGGGGGSPNSRPLRIIASTSPFTSNHCVNI